MKKFSAAYLNIISQNIDQNPDIKFTGHNFDQKFKNQLIKWMTDYQQNKDYVYDNTFRFCQSYFFVISPAYTQNPNQFKLSLDKEEYYQGHFNWYPQVNFGTFTDIETAANTLISWLKNHQ